MPSSLENLPPRRPVALKSSPKAAGRKKSGPKEKAGSSSPAQSKPGEKSPHQLRDAQPQDRPKASMMDKLSMVANVAGAGAGIFPLLQSHKDDHGAKPGQKAGSEDGEPKIEDMSEYYKQKLLANVGTPPINW